METAAFTIYDASAGSGKTYTLTKEYLKILFLARTDDAYRKILAITFTNKAVEEMKSRIVSSLYQFSIDDTSDKAMDLLRDVSKDTNLSVATIKDKSKAIIKNIIHNYAAFDISTIDKFTHKVIRTFAQDLDLPLQVQVFGGCDDTQSAALGTTAIGEGEAHIYVGTSAWVGVTTSKPLGFKNGLFCMQRTDPKMKMVVGITESAGVNTEWLLDTFYAEEKKNLSETALFELLENEIKQTTAGADYLIVTPWFLGERCPVSTTTTRSTIFNLSHQHTRAHIARAHFEGIAYNLRWTIQNLEKDFGFKITELKITGGGTLNDTWMQNIADITQRKISSTSQPKNAGALGAAMCALVGSGTFKNFSDIYQFIQTHKTYIPTTENNKIYHQLFHNYQQIYHQLKKTYHQINKDRFEIQFNENEH